MQSLKNTSLDKNLEERPSHNGSTTASDLEESKAYHFEDLKEILAKEPQLNQKDLLKHSVADAHQDDIHGLVKITDKSFVSGSKDGALKFWYEEGKKSQTIRDPQENYEKWITALSPANGNFWATGARNGEISLWNKDKCLNTFTYHPKRNYYCKERNTARINCISTPQTSYNGNSVTLYTGTPKYVQLWDAKTSKLFRYVQVSDNDWVYCIEFLPNENMMIVVGPTLEIWSPSDKYFYKHKETLINEPKRPCNRSKFFISCLTKVENRTDHYLATLFNGSVLVTNIDKKKIDTSYDEHTGRVWSAINLIPNVFATSADDAKIKIWDLRSSDSVFTISGAKGRVSSLLQLNANTFVSGSCPDDVLNSTEKAEMCFWDIRKLDSFLNM